MPDSMGGSTAQLLLTSFVRQTIERLEVAALLEHPGEVGRAREEALRDHLRSFLPPSLGVSTGFVIDARGGRSRQIDVIIHFADYHAVFRVNGIPLIPVEAVIAVFEVKSSAESRSVIYDCYDVLRSVKALDRSNDGRNVVLMDRQPLPIARKEWSHFNLQVFGAVLAARSGSRELWLNSTEEWCRNNDRDHWPNFYCGVKDYIGAYRTLRRGPTPCVTANQHVADELVVYLSERESPLAWATLEILNFVRVALRVDYSPTDYLSPGWADGPEMPTRPLPRRGDAHG